MLPSTIPAVIAYLMDVFTDDAELGGDGVDVIEGENTNPLSREWITIGDADSQEEWAALGAKSRNEVYEIEVGVASVRSGDERAEARAQVFDRLGRMATLLRATPTPPIPGMVHIEFAGVRKYNAPSPQGDDEGFVASALFAIRVTARI